MWFDSHAHLYDLTNEDLDACLNHAHAARVQRIINVGTSIKTSRTVLDQAMQHAGLFAAAGISAFDVDELGDSWEHDLQALLVQPDVVALGEIGIDGANPAYSDLEKQLPVFKRQLAIGAEHDMPVIIHSRGVEKRAAELAQAAGVRRAVFHCFTGTADAMDAVLRAGYYVSFSGIITFKKTALGELVKTIPEDRLLIETDTPYLAPVPHRGKKNEPAWVSDVGTKASGLRGVDPQRLAEITSRNASSLFGL